MSDGEHSAEQMAWLLESVGRLIDRNLDNAIGIQVMRLEELERRIEKMEIWPRERDVMRPGYDA